MGCFVVAEFLLVLPARRHATGEYNMALCLSVCLSQVDAISKRLQESSSFLAYRLPQLHWRWKGVWNFGFLQKQEYAFLWNFVLPNSGLIKFSPQLVDRRKCCQHSSTDDRRQFITLSPFTFTYKYNTI